jgi:uncharacterized protein (TIGR03032 family)
MNIPWQFCWKLNLQTDAQEKPPVRRSRQRKTFTGPMQPPAVALRAGGLLVELYHNPKTHFMTIAAEIDQAPTNGMVPTAGTREVRYECSKNFAPLLAHLGVSLVVSTYQAGKLIVLGTQDRSLSLSFHNFKRAMGVALTGDRMAVGTADQVWLLRSAPQIAPHLDSNSTYDNCFLTRGSWFTGEIQSHEMSWIGNELWVVNTLFSCLCTLDYDHNFVPRWRPNFISTLAAEDRCHLNGLAVIDGKLRYITALGETDTPGGWRTEKATGGCLIDIESNEVVFRGLVMPHSPRVHQDRVLLLNSGEGQLVQIDTRGGSAETIAELPGYTRGLAIHGGLAFVGLSRVRERSTFNGLPLESRRAELKCGLAVIEITTGRVVATFEFHSGVEEIFDVQIVHARLPAISGPYSHEEDQAPIWLLPAAGSNPQS